MCTSPGAFEYAQSCVSPAVVVAPPASRQRTKTTCSWLPGGEKEKAGQREEGASMCLGTRVASGMHPSLTASIWTENSTFQRAQQRKRVIVIAFGHKKMATSPVHPILDGQQSRFAFLFSSSSSLPPLTACRGLVRHHKQYCLQSGIAGIEIILSQPFSVHVSIWAYNLSLCPLYDTLSCPASPCIPTYLLYPYPSSLLPQIHAARSVVVSRVVCVSREDPSFWSISYILHGKSVIRFL